MNFLDRLARVLNMEDAPRDVGLDIQTESLLMRAEQLSRLESDKLVDKVTATRLWKLLGLYTSVCCVQISSFLVDSEVCHRCGVSARSMTFPIAK